MVAGTGDVQDREGLGGLPGGQEQCRDAALESGDALFIPNGDGHALLLSREVEQRRLERRHRVDGRAQVEGLQPPPAGVAVGDGRGDLAQQRAVAQDRLADELPIEQVAKRWIVASDPDEAVAAVEQYVDAGLNHLVFHAPGHDQQRFLENFERDLAPRLRKLD